MAVGAERGAVPLTAALTWRSTVARPSTICEETPDSVPGVSFRKGYEFRGDTPPIGQILRLSRYQVYK